MEHFGKLVELRKNCVVSTKVLFKYLRQKGLDRRILGSKKVEDISVVF